MKTKRFLSILIAVLMMVACFAVTASADNAAIKNTSADVSLTIVLKSGTEEQTTAGTTGKTEGTVKTDVAGTPIKDAVFELYLQAADGTIGSTPTATGKTGEDGKVTFTKTGTNNAGEKLAQGRYTVKNKKKGQDQLAAIADFAVDLPMTTVADTGFIYDVYVYPKTPIDTSKPTVTKQVAKADSGNFGQSTDEYTLNSGFSTWKITSDSLPTTIKAYKTYTFTDVIDERLTPNTSSVAVKYIDAEGAEKTMTAETDYTATWSKVSDKYDKVVVALSTTGIAKLEAGKKVFFTYTTTIDTAKAGAVAQIIGNHVVLDYKNSADSEGRVDNTPNRPGDDPNRPGDDTFKPDDPTNWPDTDVPNPDFDPTKPEDPKTNPPTITIKTPSNPGDTPGTDDPYVWTGKIEGLKTDNAATPAPLEGAEFTLYTDAECTTQAAGTSVVTSAADGTFSFVGLEANTYYLLETKAPEGYELNGAATKIEIVSPLTEGQTATKAPAVSVTIKDIPSTKLPVTGGMGVGMFALVGAALALAGVVFMKKTGRSEA